jgi:acetyltransferase-like isoleucine patch superfamily enzyme
MGNPMGQQRLNQELIDDSQIDRTPGLHTKMFDTQKSNVQKYREMTIGNGGWFALLRYELTMLLVNSLPGALGLLLRKKLYKPLFKQVGRNVIFGRDLVLRHPHKISLGDNVIIDDGCLLDAKGEDNEGITIGSGFTLGRYSSLVCKNGNIKIGSHVNIGSTVKIVVGQGGTVEIGNSIDIGSSSHFSGGSYDYSQIDVLPSSQRQATQGIVVEDMAWIGVGVVLLDGVRVGAQSIVGAGSVVNRSVPLRTIVAGVPAQVIKERT